MAISLTAIGTNKISTATGTSLAITVGVGGVPASCNIIVINQETGTTSAVGTPSDSASNTYNKAVGDVVGGGASNGAAAIWYAENVAALVNGNTISMTLTSGHNAAISAMYATGLATSSSLDAAVTVTEFASASTITALTSGTPAVSGELFIATLNWRNGVTGTQDTGHGWAAPPTAVAQGTVPSCSILGGTQVNAGTGTKVWQPTVSGAAIYWAAIVGFKPATATPFIFSQPSSEIAPPPRRDIEAKSFLPLPPSVAPAVTPFNPSQADIGYRAQRLFEPSGAPIIPRSTIFVVDRSQIAAPPLRRAVESSSFIPKAPAIIIRPAPQDIPYRAIRALLDAGRVLPAKVFFKQPAGDDSTLLKPPELSRLDLWTPFVAPIPPAVLDVFVKDWRKKRRHGRDPIELEIEDKARRRAALERAIYGPGDIEHPETAFPLAELPQLPPNVDDLARAIMQARAAHEHAQRQAFDMDDEEILEMILRDI